MAHNNAATHDWNLVSEFPIDEGNNVASELAFWKCKRCGLQSTSVNGEAPDWASFSCNESMMKRAME
jgi:hypothetical protein